MDSFLCLLKKEKKKKMGKYNPSLYLYNYFNVVLFCGDFSSCSTKDINVRLK